MAVLKIFKKNATILRISVTKLLNNTDTIAKNDPVDLKSLELVFNQLNVKSFNLNERDNKIEPLLNLDEYEAETSVTYEYVDKIFFNDFLR